MLASPVVRRESCFQRNSTFDSRVCDCHFGDICSLRAEPSGVQVPTVIDGSQIPEEACTDLPRDEEFARRIQKRRIPLTLIEYISGNSHRWLYKHPFLCHSYYIQCS